jgi:hypothetical protein
MLDQETTLQPSVSAFHPFGVPTTRIGPRTESVTIEIGLEA